MSATLVYRCIHVNANALRAHLGQVESLFLEEHIDVLGITESWCELIISDNMIALPNLYIVRKDEVYD